MQGIWYLLAPHPSPLVTARSFNLFARLYADGRVSCETASEIACMALPAAS
jgi:hypothetical protein